MSLRISLADFIENNFQIPPSLLKGGEGAFSPPRRDSRVAKRQSKPPSAYAIAVEKNNQQEVKA
jgi:hypothetical protein